MLSEQTIADNNKLSWKHALLRSRIVIILVVIGVFLIASLMWANGMAIENWGTTTAAAATTTTASRNQDNVARRFSEEEEGEEEEGEQVHRMVRDMPLNKDGTDFGVKHTGASRDQVKQHVVESYRHLSEQELLALVEQRLRKYEQFLNIDSVHVIELDRYIQQHGPPANVDLNMAVQLERDEVQYRYIHIPTCEGLEFCSTGNVGIAQAAARMGMSQLPGCFTKLDRRELDERIRRQGQRRTQDTLLCCGNHASFDLYQNVNHDPSIGDLWNITGTLKHLSMSTVFRGSTSRYLSYWYESLPFRELFQSPFCQPVPPDQQPLCPKDFERHKEFLWHCHSMVHVMSASQSIFSDLAWKLRTAMLNVLKCDVFAFLEHKDIRATIYSHVYGGKIEDYYAEAPSDTWNGIARKGPTPSDYEPWQLARLSYLQRYEAGLVDFAKHLLVYRWHSLLTLKQMQDTLSIDEDWITPEGQVYWQR